MYKYNYMREIWQVLVQRKAQYYVVRDELQTE